MKVVFSCGRMNPPTLGHARLIEEMMAVSTGEACSAKLFATRTWDMERNPLAPEIKKQFLEEAFGLPVELTVSPFTALEALAADGVNEIIFMVGEDRRAHFEGLVKYAATLGVTMSLRSISREASSESATKARDAVREDDRQTFFSLTPSPHEGYQERLFHAVRRGVLGEACR